MKYAVALIVASFAFVAAPLANAAQPEIPIKVVTAPSGIEYATGGVGRDSVAKIDELARTRGFNVKLTFAWDKGNFVAGIPVTIHDAQGNKIFDMPNVDPIVVLHLKQGTYTAAAMYNGKVEQRQFKAPVSGLEVVRFSWPQPMDSPGVAAR